MSKGQRQSRESGMATIVAWKTVSAATVISIHPNSGFVTVTAAQDEVRSSAGKPNREDFDRHLSAPPCSSQL